MCRLICTFVAGKPPATGILALRSISKLATGEIPILYVVSVAVETCFEYHNVGNPEGQFCHVKAQIIIVILF